MVYVASLPGLIYQNVRLGVYISLYIIIIIILVPTFSPPDSEDQVDRVWATLDYPYENINSEMFSAQIVWTPLPGVTEYEVSIQDFEFENILVGKILSISFVIIISGKPIQFKH